MHHWVFRSGLYGENFSLLEGSLTYCSYSNYHGRASFSYISMQLLANRLLKKQKVGSARRVSLFNFFDGRFTLVAVQRFLHW